MARGRKKDKIMTGDNVSAETTLVSEDEVTETAAATSEAAAESESTEEAIIEDVIAAEAEKTTSAEAGPEEDKTQNLEQQLELARKEAAANLEGWQRAAAELANFKRRQEEQLKLQRDMIKSEVLQGVISALDDMELAFQNVPAELNGQLIGWVEGFRLVQRKLDKVLEDQNVKPIKTEGGFDPNIHEAVSYEQSDEHEEGQIIAEIRKGYQTGNRVLRPALVRVAR